LFRQSARLIAVSQFIRATLIDRGAPDAKVTVAPIGIPVRPDTPNTRRGDHLLFVGRLIRQKGCADLLEALSGIDGAPPLLVIGDGPQRAELEQLAQRLRVRATFAGARDTEYVARAMASGIAFCVPSKREGLGMVFLEAAAARLPVVSYASGGISEAVIDGETGLLAPEGNVGALARLLRQVIDDAELAARLGAAGRHRVEAEFDISKRAAQLELLYDKVVQDAPTAAPSWIGVH
jgi:glycosyltransferase involved in cell wall biosynthesis